VAEEHGPDAAAAITDATVVGRNGPVPAIPAGDGLVLLSLEQGRYVELDEIGAAIWSRLEVPRPFAGLVDELAAAYDGERGSIAADVRAWLLRLREIGLIELTTLGV
jgi:hypothetical protein